MRHQGSPLYTGLLNVGYRQGVVLKFLGSVARVAFGFILASVAAGLVMMLFVNTPSDVLAQPVNRLPRTAGETFELALLTATHLAIFSFIFALIVAALGELFSLRSLPFYLIGGVMIALLGFFAQYSSEIGSEPTVLNNYALKTFLTTGFFAGFVYWLASGQFAGKAPAMTGTVSGAAGRQVTAELRAPVLDENEHVIIRRIASEALPKRTYQTLLTRLSFRPRDNPANLERPADSTSASQNNPGVAR